MSMNDKEAFDFYSDPEHQVPAGSARRRSKPGLRSHVPVRFLPETIAKVKILATRDRKTVSAWIRDVVEREIERRLPDPRSEAVEWEVKYTTTSPRDSVTEVRLAPESHQITNLATV